MTDHSLFRALEASTEMYSLRAMVSDGPLYGLVDAMMFLRPLQYSLGAIDRSILRAFSFSLSDKMHKHANSPWPVGLNLAHPLAHHQSYCLHY